MEPHTCKIPAPSRPAHAPLFVAIVGGSGAGKTWLAKKLQAALNPNAARVSLDDFYRDCSRVRPERRGKLNFDNPRAIDWRAMEQALNALRAGRSARLPCYDFKTHCRLAQTSTLAHRPVVLVDGLWLLHRRSLRRLFGLKIFVDCPARTRRTRRLARDLRARGRKRGDILEQLQNTVEPMHARFVVPQQKWADIVLRHNLGARDVRRLAQQLRERLDLPRPTKAGDAS